MNDADVIRLFIEGTPGPQGTWRGNALAALRSLVAERDHIAALADVERRQGMEAQARMVFAEAQLQHLYATLEFVAGYADECAQSIDRPTRSDFRALAAHARERIAMQSSGVPS